MNVTKHATKRIKTRLGVPKQSSDRIAGQALEYGIRHSDTTGALNRYITNLYFRHSTANNIRVFNSYVYIFQDEKLITVFQLPQKFRKAANRIADKKKKEVQDEKENQKHNRTNT